MAIMDVEKRKLQIYHYQNDVMGIYVMEEYSSMHPRQMEECSSTLLLIHTSLFSENICDGGIFLYAFKATHQDGDNSPMLLQIHTLLFCENICDWGIFLYAFRAPHQYGGMFPYVVTDTYTFV